MKIFFDFDNTLVNTTEAFCKYVEWTFDGAYISPYEVREYDFSDQMKFSKDELINAFSSDRLFNYLRPYTGVRNVLEELQKSGLFEMYLVSNCSTESASKKLNWLQEFNFDKYFTGKIMLTINKPYDKSLINMSNSIFVDDHKLNHLSSNAKYKYAFVEAGTNRKWAPTEAYNVKVFNGWYAPIAREWINIAENNK